MAEFPRHTIERDHVGRWQVGFGERDGFGRWRHGFVPHDVLAATAGAWAAHLTYHWSGAWRGVPTQDVWAVASVARDECIDKGLIVG